MCENVGRRADDRRTDDGQTDAGVIGITVQFYQEIITCDPSVYTMDHP